MEKWAKAKLGGKGMAAERYGGDGPFQLPRDHEAGMRVPKGGSSCANCRFLDERDDGPHCKEENFVVWTAGETRLPVDDPSTYCSDWWRPKA